MLARGLVNALGSKRLVAKAFQLTAQRNFGVSQISLVSQEFEKAKARSTTLKEDPGSDVKLKMYALFKQATVGPCNAPKPSMVDFVGRAKWSAWNELGKLTQADAEKQYIQLIDQLVKEDQGGQEASDAQPAAAAGKFENIITSIEYNSIYKIVLNRPAKYNAITVKMYNEIMQALSEADKNPNVVMAVITGNGKYYCAGNDLDSFGTPEAMKNMKKAAEDGRVLFETFVNSFINFSKPLGAVVNGPAVGISVTLLGLFDLVLASDKATFSTPFTKIAQSPEGCSTYTFPRLMGSLKASEMLIFNRTLSAQEAYERNLVTEVIADAEFQGKAWKKIEEISKLPKESLLASRRLMRDGVKDKLVAVNKKEATDLAGRWVSKEFVTVITQFWSGKRKQ